MQKSSILILFTIACVASAALVDISELRDGELSNRERLFSAQVKEALSARGEVTNARYLVDPETPHITHSPDRFVNPAGDDDFCHRKLKIESCPATPVDPVHIPEDHQVELWAFQAPVFEEAYGPIFGKMGLFHVAVGLRDKTSGVNYTVEYDAFYEVPNATFPHVVVQPDGSEDLIWCNKGAICKVDFINDTYWHVETANQWYLGDINGTQFNAYMDYIKQDNVTHDQYESWVAKLLKTSPYYDVWQNSSTCDDFNFRSYYKFQDLGVEFPANITELPRDFLTLFTEQPTKVDYNATKKEILDFYEVFQTKGMDILKFIEHLLDFELGPKFLYNYGEYYQIHFKEPYLFIGPGNQRVRH